MGAFMKTEEGLMFCLFSDVDRVLIRLMYLEAVFTGVKRSCCRVRNSDCIFLYNEGFFHMVRIRSTYSSGEWLFSVCRYSALGPIIQVKAGRLLVMGKAPHAIASMATSPKDS
jgi:hypothetical protein